MFAVVAISAALALVACDPTTPGPSGSPSPSESASESPTPGPQGAPEPGDLVITPEGMGTLVFLQAPSDDPELQMVELDPNRCADSTTGEPRGVPDGDPAAARWVPIEAYETSENWAPWGVVVNEGGLVRIDVFDESIPTDQGIRIGDSVDELLAAYPGVTPVDEYLTDVYVIPGTAGSLHIEVAKDPADMVGYWEGRDGQVVYLRGVDASQPAFTVAASENIAGACI
jgi:hypothetical protein